MHIPPDAQAEIQSFLAAVKRHLNDSSENSAEILEEIERHIREKLASDGVTTPSRQDVLRILAEMDPPESYACDKPHETNSSSLDTHASDENSLGQWSLMFAMLGMVIPVCIIVAIILWVDEKDQLSGYVLAFILGVLAELCAFFMSIPARKQTRAKAAMGISGCCLVTAILLVLMLFTTYFEHSSPVTEGGTGHQVDVEWEIDDVSIPQEAMPVTAPDAAPQETD